MVLYGQCEAKTKKYSTLIGKGITQEIYDKFAEKTLRECQATCDKLLNGPGSFEKYNDGYVVMDQTQCAKIEQMNEQVHNLQKEVTYNKSLIEYLQKTLDVSISDVSTNGQSNGKKRPRESENDTSTSNTTSDVNITRQQSSNAKSVFSSTEVKLTKGSEASANRILQQPDIKELITKHTAVIATPESSTSDKMVSVQFIRVLFKSKNTPMDVIDNNKVLDALCTLILKPDTDEYLLERTLVCVFHLLSNTRPGFISRMKYACQLGLVSRLVQILYQPVGLVDIYQDVLCILNNFVAESPEFTDDFVEHNALPRLFQMITPNPLPEHDKVYMQLANLLRSMTITHNLTTVTLPPEIAPDGTLHTYTVYDKIYTLITAANPAVVNSGCRILANVLGLTRTALQAEIDANTAATSGAGGVGAAAAAAAAATAGDSSAAVVVPTVVDLTHKSEVQAEITSVFPTLPAQIIQRVLSIINSHDQHITVHRNAILALLEIIRLLPLAEIHNLLNNNNLVMLLSTQLRVITKSTELLSTKKYTEICKCLYELLLLVGREKIAFTVHTIARLKEYESMRTVEFELADIAQDVLDLYYGAV